MSVIIDVFMPGILEVDNLAFPCALGPAGIVPVKKEGDHATPTGEFPLRQVMYRSDRIAKPKTDIPVRPIQKSDGWCDDPNHMDYNRLITLPHEASHEVLWRDDRGIA